MKRVLIWGSLLVVVLIGLAVGGYFMFLRPATPKVLTGSSAKVTREDLDVLIKCQGLIVAATTIEVKSRASGYVQRVHATAGDRVKKDQILLEVDPARSKLNEEEARSEVEAARSQLRLSEESLDTERIALLRTRVERQRQLMEKGLIKREDTRDLRATRTSR